MENKQTKRKSKGLLTFVAALVVSAALVLLIGCPGKKGDGKSYVDTKGNKVEQGKAAEEAFPYSGDEMGEKVVESYGNKTIRLASDDSFSHPDKMKNKEKCFIVMSKKDYYLYVYEPQGKDTVMLARYDCCFALKKGNKEREGDMKTPHCTMENPFTITEIVDASGWEHDFGDGRGSILSYGRYFHRLDTHGHKGIGIHGSTNNEGSVPGRASEGCIRLHDKDIKDLGDNYTYVGMPVVIKAEDVDDLPFEIHAMKKQDIKRKRHLDPAQAAQQ